MSSVLLPWVEDLSFMKQAVLMTCTRGPDGVHKEHIAKPLVRWLRRCVFYSAFDKMHLTRPYDPPGMKLGGSFTGASLVSPLLVHWDDGEELKWWSEQMDVMVTRYLKDSDELPSHFQDHFRNAVEVLAYDYFDAAVADWWYATYKRLCNAKHLGPESMNDYNTRLGDNEKDWRKTEYFMEK